MQVVEHDLDVGCWKRQFEEIIWSGLDESFLLVAKVLDIDHTFDSILAQDLGSGCDNV